jgi:GTP cyclohydrolase I
MKLNEILLNTLQTNTHMEDWGDDHLTNNINTPLREDAFDLTDDEKINIIQQHMYAILDTLGLDLTDDSLKGTPLRVAKMYVKEVFSGLNPINKPDAKLFDNTYNYNELLIEKDITLYSYCEHHLVPIYGKVHVAYISNGQVIGLSKINRIVQYYARRPQVQERLTLQIAQGLKEALNTEDIAIIVDAKHLCVASRGIKDTASSTITTHFSGKFTEESKKQEFISLIHQKD